MHPQTRNINLGDAAWKMERKQRAGGRSGHESKQNWSGEDQEATSTGQTPADEGKLAKNSMFNTSNR